MGYAYIELEMLVVVVVSWANQIRGSTWIIASFSSDSSEHSEMSTETSTAVRQLFGGAITITLPTFYMDAS